MDANVQTGERIGGEDEGTMGEFGRNELNDNGRLLLTFATDKRLLVLNTFFDRRGGEIWYTYNGPSGSKRKYLDYMLTRQSHRGQVSNMEVVPQPVRPVRAGSDHNVEVATVDLGGRLAHNRPVRTNRKPRQLNRQELQVEARRGGRCLSGLSATSSQDWVRRWPLRR